MKKLIISFICLALAVAVHAQSLSDNEFFRKSQELSIEAQAAFEAGDYDRATKLADQSVDFAWQSDEYVAMMLAKKSASDAIEAAQQRYDWATSVKADTRFAEAYVGATEKLAAARASFAEAKYADAKAHAMAADTYLAVVSGEEAFPASFVVRDLSVKHDCLWRIAGLPFVYNDPFKWPLLYTANKKSLPDPNNPDLILPGMTLLIPPLSGEIREGVWKEGQKYPTFKTPSK